MRKKAANLKVINTCKLLIKILDVKKFEEHQGKFFSIRPAITPAITAIIISMMAFIG